MTERRRGIAGLSLTGVTFPGSEQKGRRTEAADQLRHQFTLQLSTSNIHSTKSGLLKSLSRQQLRLDGDEGSGWPTCAVGWRWHRVVLLFFYELEGNCTEVALVLNNQVTECNNQLLSKTETPAGQFTPTVTRLSSKCVQLQEARTSSSRADFFLFVISTISLARRHLFSCFFYTAE